MHLNRNALRIQVILSVCMLVPAGCAEKKPPVPPPPPLPSVTTLPPPTLVASDRAVILIYRDSSSGPPQASQNPLDVAVWGDGRIVWRASGMLLQGHVDPKMIDDLLQRLHGEGVFGDGRTYYGNIGPDAKFEVIEVRLEDRELKLASWHERFAQNPRVVVTAHGVEALAGRDPEAVLADGPEEYQRFRQVWSDIRSTVKSWEPAAGEPFTDTVPIGPGT